MGSGGELPVLQNQSGAALRCPSAQPDMPDARVLGVVQDESGGRRVSYLDESLPVTPDILEMVGDVEPTEVMRFSAVCDVQKCMHYDGTRCQLATRTVQRLPAVVDVLPACNIRPTCRWYAQEGYVACQRCPQVVTINNTTDPTLIEIAYGPEKPNG